MKKKKKVDRRRFLKGLGAAGAGFALPAFFSCGAPGPRGAGAEGSAGAAAAPGRGGAAAARGAAGRPNIVFLFSDDHAWQAIGAYGSRINKTPSIDRIAREGAILTHNTCCNSLCAPSRAAILTGEHSHVNGLKTNADVFDGSQATFPKILNAAGYNTAIIGKWHLKSDPTGFDYWDILPGQGSYYNPDFITAQGKRRIQGYNTDITADLALRWLKEGRDKDKPFLLMCQFKAPHRNWMPPLKYLHLYDDKVIPEPGNLFDDYSHRASPIRKNKMSIARHLIPDYDLKILPEDLSKMRYRWPFARMTPDQYKTFYEAYAPKNEAFRKAHLKGRELVSWRYQRFIKDYLRCIASVDDNVGRVLDYLDASGLSGNTLVVYSSDQGFFLGEHGLFDKRWMYRESFGMPFIARWPGRIPAGRRVGELAQNIDFAPTFLEAAGLDAPKEMQGESFLGLLEGKEIPGWRRSLYYNYWEGVKGGGHGVERQEGVATAHYKLIHYYDVGEWELFDLDKDPSEMRSVYGDPAYAKVEKEMKAELARLKKKYGVPEKTASSGRKG